MLANVDNHEPNNNFVGRTTAVGDGGILYLPLYYGPLDVEEQLTTRSAQCRQVDRLRPHDPDAVDYNLPIYNAYDWDCPPLIYDTGGYLSRSRPLNEVNIQRLRIWRMPPDSWRQLILISGLFGGRSLIHDDAQYDMLCRAAYNVNSLDREAYLSLIHI